MAHQRTRIGMADESDSEEILNLAFETGRGIARRGERWKRGRRVQDAHRRQREPSIRRMRKQVVTVEGRVERAAIVGADEHQVRTKRAAQQVGHRGHGIRRHRGVQFIRPADDRQPED